MMLVDKQNLKFDEQLMAIGPSLRWLPWIGKNYFQIRLLIIGDSFYEDKDDNEWLHDKFAPRYLVNNQGLQSNLPQFANAKFFRKTEQTVLFQDKTTFKERDTFWTSIAFFNLVQRPLLSRNSSDRPKDQDFNLGWSVALEVAKILRPNLIVKLGIAGIGQLGYYLNNNDAEWERNAIEFYKRPFIINLKRLNQQIKLVCINHPTGSRNYDYKKWAIILRETEPALMDKLKSLIVNK
ncbi:MAG: hypothetical protein Q8867_03830 [Bacteroidota bacterium]|nr:hypothetical protein [Bacteroidota bacterium]